MRSNIRLYFELNKLIYSDQTKVFVSLFFVLKIEFINELKFNHLMSVEKILILSFCCFTRIVPIRISFKLFVLEL